MSFNQDVAILSISVLALSLGVFYIHAYIVSKEDFTLKGFTIADQALTKERFANTFAAGTLSLSTVFAFMLATVNIYGAWLIFAPATMFLGTWLLAFAIESYQVDVGSEYTQASFTLEVFGSRTLTLIITTITVISFIGTVFLEIFFGTIIFTIFLPEGEIFKFGSYVLLALLVLGYLRMGGYRVVVVTDTWQMFLIGVSVVLLLLLSLFIPADTTPSIDALNVFGNGGYWSIFIFCSWITALNMFQPFGRLSSWQRFAALDVNISSTEATKESWWKFFLVWVLPIISFIVLLNKGYDISGLSEFFSFLASPSDIFTMALFPVVYAGFAAMLLSTIDTRLIAALTSVADSATFGPRLQKLEEENPKTLKKVATLAVIMVFVILGLIYYTATVDFFNLLTTLINVIFNGLTVFAPIVGYGIYTKGFDDESIQSVRNGDSWILCLGLIVSYFIIVGMSIYGFYENNNSIGQMSLFVSLVVMSFFVWLYSKSTKQPA